MQVTSQDIDLLIELVDDLCGLYLDHSKGYLIESRLESLAQQHSCRSFGELARVARSSDKSALRDEIVDAITTNETSFFRDASPFEALRHKVLPELIDQVDAGRAPRRLRIWSAASSTGQEAYSLAMTLREVIPDAHSWQISILATDVSRAALKRAEEGCYTDLEMSRGVEGAALSKYFDRQGDCWQLKDEVRRMVRFESRNLLAPFAERDHFDIVFCRNVAIYFQKDQRDDLFRRLVTTMAPGGFLFVGSAESLSHLGADFTPQVHCNCTIYRPKQSQCAGAFI